MHIQGNLKIVSDSERAIQSQMIASFAVERRTEKKLVSSLGTWSAWSFVTETMRSFLIHSIIFRFCALKGVILSVMLNAYKFPRNVIADSYCRLSHSQQDYS